MTASIESHAVPTASGLPASDDYWSLARQPLHCLLFLLPLIVTYELGAALFAAGDSARNGADYWLRWVLGEAGCQYPWILPVAIVAALIVRQFTGRFRWRPSPGTLCGMLAESLFFGGCLVLVGQLQDLAFRQSLAQATAAVPVQIGSHEGSLPLAISYLGAGVYEEILFRACLLPLVAGALRCLLVPRTLAIGMAIVGTSILFSLAHYVGPVADQFTWFSFVFRATAGVFFSLLFLVRGFGVTVGSHAAYDLIVGLLIPAFL
ncbi:MAG: CPBP family intramembrane metalloprotease [Planctomycetes bacterium]|nr:CPBP family intramembrane metalloprotease [Planctomycetota bacterium]